MKYIYLLFSSVIVTALFSNCAGSRELQETPPARFEQAYINSSAGFYELIIPINVNQENQVKLDSVYFRGSKAALIEDPSKGVYTATFKSGKRDLIMSSDPKEEYANKAPQKPVKAPFEIKEDEAVIVYNQDEKTRYYKITGIKEAAQK